MTGIRGGSNATPRTTSSQAGSIGSSNREWNAWLTESRWVARPALVNSARAAATSGAAPVITVLRGPLMAAISTPGQRSSTDCRASMPASTAAIVPPGGSACIKAPRRATRRMPVAASNMPAMQAAANSPTL